MRSIGSGPDTGGTVSDDEAPDEAFDDPFLKLLPPGGVMMTECVVTYAYLDDEGDECWGLYVLPGGTTMRLIGLLEQAKGSLMADVIAHLNGER